MRRLVLLLLVLLAAACSGEPATGPVDPVWDRTACEHCQMVISDRRHAVQIREAAGLRPHQFDDLGCALTWLAASGIEAKASAAGTAVELWVRDAAGKTWIDGWQARYLEACMASSITQARQGTLYLMCGGRSEVFERARPLLEKLSASMRYVGTAGQAAQVKALVNMVMNINTAGLAEGLGLGDALGLDLAMLREVFSQTGANSQVLKTDGEDMQNRDHACFFSAAHAAKDSGIALKLGKARGLKLPLAAATKKQYDRMVAEGLGELDKSGIAELTFKGRRGSGG